MNAYTNSNAYEMRLPKGFVEMSKDEMEYDGGLFWSIALSVVGWGYTIVGNATNNKDLQHAGDLITIAGLISNPITVFGGAMKIVANTAMKKTINGVAYGATMGALDNVVGGAGLFTDKW